MSHTTQERPLFSRRAIWFIFGFGGLTLVLTVLLMVFTDAREEVKSIDTDTYSMSAIGHVALHNVLEKHDIKVVRGRYRSHELMWKGDLLMVAEPHLMADDESNTLLVKKYREMLASSSNTMLVLPKRDGLRDRYDEDWIGASFMVHESDLRYVLLASGMDQVTVSRTYKDASDIQWSYAADMPQMAPTLKGTQLILPAEGVEPLIWSPYGILFARVKSDLSSRPVYVLSDPDVLANHGLHQGENSALMLALIQSRLASNSGDVVIDEVVHGHEKIPTFEQRLMRFPLLPMTVQFLVLILFLFWRLFLRFGPPLRYSRERAPGKAFMVQHTASLLNQGGHIGYTLERYVWMVLQDTAATLNAPSTMNQAELVSWLESMAKTRHVKFNLRQVVTQVHSISDGLERVNQAKALEIAMKVNRFSKDMIDES